MLIDNGSTINIPYWDAYQKTRLTRADLSPTFGYQAGDHVNPKGTIKLADTLGEHL